jgi:hypothetical protein
MLLRSCFNLSRLCNSFGVCLKYLFLALSIVSFSITSAFDLCLILFSCNGFNARFLTYNLSIINVASENDFCTISRILSAIFNDTSLTLNLCLKRVLRSVFMSASALPYFNISMITPSFSFVFLLVSMVYISQHC